VERIFPLGLLYSITFVVCVCILDPTDEQDQLNLLSDLMILIVYQKGRRNRSVASLKFPKMPPSIPTLGFCRWRKNGAPTHFDLVGGRNRLILSKYASAAVLHFPFSTSSGEREREREEIVPPTLIPRNLSLHLLPRLFLNLWHYSSAAIYSSPNLTYDLFTLLLGENLVSEPADKVEETR